MPRVLTPAASKAASKASKAEFIAFDHPGVPLQVICFPDITPPANLDETLGWLSALVGVCVSGEHVFVAEDHPGSRL